MPHEYSKRGSAPCAPSLAMLITYRVGYSAVLLIPLVEYDIQYQTCNHGTKCAKLHSIGVVPSEEVTEHQYDRGNNNDDNAQILQDSVHNAILFLYVFSKYFTKKHNILQMRK